MKITQMMNEFVLYLHYRTYGSIITGVAVVLLLLFLSTMIGYYSFTTKQQQYKSCPVADTTTSATTVKANKKERPVVICPFSQDTDFIVETAENLPLTPLEAYEDWVMDYLQTDNDTDLQKKPLAARWLNMGMSGQDTPGILRAGLRRLKNTKYFLVEEPHRLKTELLLKKKALDDPQRFPHVFVMEPESLNAQRELLDMFMAYLPRRYPDQYVYDPIQNTIHLKCRIDTF